MNKQTEKGKCVPKGRTEDWIAIDRHCIPHLPFDVCFPGIATAGVDVWTPDTETGRCLVHPKLVERPIWVPCVIVVRLVLLQCWFPGMVTDTRARKKIPDMQHGCPFLLQACNLSMSSGLTYDCKISVWTTNSTRASNSHHRSLRYSR